MFFFSCFLRAHFVGLETLMMQKKCKKKRNRYNIYLLSNKNKGFHFFKFVATNYLLTEIFFTSKKNILVTEDHVFYSF